MWVSWSHMAVLVRYTRASNPLLTPSVATQVILYLSYFYKHHELSIRLAFFWTGLTLADILAAILAFGLLHMRGVHGASGWRWMFLLEVSTSLFS